MAEGLNSEYEQESWVTDCLDCEIEDTCCDDACEGRVWVAPCGSIDYTNGEILNIAAFCEPPNVTALSYDPGITIREKQYRGCRKSRRPNQPDPSFTISWDICQSHETSEWLLGTCPFDFVLAPKGAELDLAANPSIFNQPTFVAWGRVIGDSYTWEFPDDDCQNTSRTFMTESYSWNSGLATA